MWAEPQQCQDIQEAPQASEFQRTNWGRSCQEPKIVNPELGRSQGQRRYTLLQSHQHQCIWRPQSLCQPSQGTSTNRFSLLHCVGVFKAFYLISGPDRVGYIAVLFWNSGECCRPLCENASRQDWTPHEVGQETWQVGFSSGDRLHWGESGKTRLPCIAIALKKCSSFWEQLEGQTIEYLFDTTQDLNEAYRAALKTATYVIKGCSVGLHSVGNDLPAACYERTSSSASSKRKSPTPVAGQTEDSDSEIYLSETTGR